LAGYFLGTIPFIKNNFEIVVMAIIVFSLVPIIVEFVKEKIKK